MMPGARIDDLFPRRSRSRSISPVYGFSHGYNYAYAPTPSPPPFPSSAASSSARLIHHSSKRAAAQKVCRSAFSKAASLLSRFGSAFESKSKKERPTSTFIMPSEYAAAAAIAAKETSAVQHRLGRTASKRSTRSRQVGAVAKSRGKLQKRTYSRRGRTMSRRDRRGGFSAGSSAKLRPEPMGGFRASTLYIANPDPKGCASSSSMALSQVSSISIKAIPEEARSRKSATPSWKTISTFAESLPTTPTYWNQRNFSFGAAQQIGNGDSRAGSISPYTQPENTASPPPDISKKMHIEDALAALEGDVPKLKFTALSKCCDFEGTLKQDCDEGKHIDNTPYQPDPHHHNKLYIPYSKLFSQGMFDCKDWQPAPPLSQEHAITSLVSRLPSGTSSAASSILPLFADTETHRKHYTSIESGNFAPAPPMDHIRCHEYAPAPLFSSEAMVDIHNPIVDHPPAVADDVVPYYLPSTVYEPEDGNFSRPFRRTKEKSVVSYIKRTMSSATGEDSEVPILAVAGRVVLRGNVKLVEIRKTRC